MEIYHPSRLGFATHAQLNIPPQNIHSLALHALDASEYLNHIRYSAKKSTKQKGVSEMKRKKEA